jgi:hypothetical protein
LSWTTDAMRSDAEADFGEPGASWGTITHVGVWTLVTGGTFRGWAAIAPSIPAEPGIRVFVAAGDFRMRVLPEAP